MDRTSIGVGLVVGLLSCAPTWAAPTDTDVPVDADADGFTVAMGDCDDDDGETYPGATERCGDQADNDCDGFVDERCDDLLYQAEVRGGGGCTSEESLFAFTSIWLVGLAGLVRREDLS